MIASAILCATFLCVFVLSKSSRKSGTATTSATPASAPNEKSEATPFQAKILTDGEGLAPSPDQLMLPSALGPLEAPDPAKMAHELYTLGARVDALEQGQPWTKSKH